MRVYTYILVLVSLAGCSTSSHGGREPSSEVAPNVAVGCSVLGGKLDPKPAPASSSSRVVYQMYDMASGKRFSTVDEACLNRFTMEGTTGYIETADLGNRCVVLADQTLSLTPAGAVVYDMLEPASGFKFRTLNAVACGANFRQVGVAGYLKH